MRYQPMTWFVVALAGLSACAKGGASASIAPSTRTWLEVQNNSSKDVNIYLMRSGVQTKLGAVGKGTSAKIELPATMVNQGVPLRLMADPVDRTDFGTARKTFTDEIRVAPGRTAQFTIPPG